MASNEATNELEQLRDMAHDLMLSRPAETTPEAQWLVAELERNKQILVGLLDYLLSRDVGS